MPSISGINTRFFKDLFDWKRGRMNRTDYIFLLLPFCIIDGFLENPALSLLQKLPIAIPSILYVTCIDIKRLHDCGLRAWWAAPFIGLYIATSFGLHISNPFSHFDIMILLLFVCMVFFITFWPGQKHENKYGKPYKDSAMFTYRS